MSQIIIQHKLGVLPPNNALNTTIDWLNLEWFETNKRIQRKKTVSGKDIALKFLNENPSLQQDDILYEGDQSIIAVNILPCDCLVVKPNNMFEMASVCYEIGNKHLPLFFENDELLIPFEQPLFKLLTAQGFKVQLQNRKLLQPLKTTVTPHGSGNESLFSKIMKLTSPNE